MGRSTGMIRPARWEVQGRQVLINVDSIDPHRRAQRR